MKPTDWELIERCRADDQDAWTALYKRHAGCLYQVAIKVARRKHGDPEECLSHANEAFIRCVKQFDPQRGVKFITLLWRAADNACRRSDPGGAIYIPCNAFRFPSTASAAAKATVQHSLGQHRDSDTRTIGFDDVFVYSDDPAAAMDYEEQRRIAMRRLGQLPARERDILRRRSQGETLQDIAASLGVCKERVRQLETRAYERLAEQAETDVATSRDSG